MAQTKYKMPDYIRQAVKWLCRGYEDFLRWRDQQQDKLFSNDYSISGMPRGGEYHNRQEAIIEEVDAKSRSKLIQAIDYARLQIGQDLENEELIAKLRTAIWESTLDGRTYPYEVWDLPTIYRDDFYERKRKFIYDIAKYMELL